MDKQKKNNFLNQTNIGFTVLDSAKLVIQETLLDKLQIQIQEDSLQKHYNDTDSFVLSFVTNSLITDLKKFTRKI